MWLWSRKDLAETQGDIEELKKMLETLYGYVNIELIILINENCLSFVANCHATDVIMDIMNVIYLIVTLNSIHNILNLFNTSTFMLRCSELKYVEQLA